VRDHHHVNLLSAVRHSRVPALALVLPVLVTPVLLASCGDGDGGSGSVPEVELSAAGIEGRGVAEDQGCTSCHQVDGDDGIGPDWSGLAGSQVELADGSTVTADDEYLTRAIVQPNAQIVKGYTGIMPERDLADDQVAAIVAYLRDIGVRN